MTEATILRVLSLGNYPIANPRHGGQLRVRAIKDRLSAAGWQVRYFCAFDKNSYPETEPDLWNRTFTQNALADLGRHQRRSDFFAAEAIFADPGLDTIIGSMVLFDPQFLIVEHPWLWPLAKRILEFLPTAKVVYSAHNIETHLAVDAVRLAPAQVRKETLAHVSALEHDLLQHADLTIAVSQADARYFGEFTRNVIVFRNGISRPVLPGGLEYWAKRFGPARLAVFVGSAHPPNAIGLAKMLGPSLGFLSPIERILVVGGVSNIIDDVEEYACNKSTMACRMEFVGVQDEGGLATMLHLARCIILPITEGGGSNLKTAEALLSGKPIIATSVAFRGFEEFATVSRVQICDDPMSFQAALVRVLRDDVLDVGGDSTDVAAVLWPVILEELPNTLEQLIDVESRPDTIFRLNSGNGFAGVLKAGWHVHDHWGAWSSAQHATIVLPVRRDYSIHVCACISAPTGPQKVNGLAGWLGDRLLFRVDCGPIYQEKHVHFILAASDVAGCESVELTFAIDFMVRPSEHKQNDDRNLGFGLLSLEISLGSW